MDSPRSGGQCFQLSHIEAHNRGPKSFGGRDGKTVIGKKKGLHLTLKTAKIAVMERE